MFPGFGTLANVLTVLAGSGIGLVVGHRLPQRTRDTVTDGLGLVTVLIGGLSAIKVTSAALAAEIGDSAPMLVVLGSILIGGIVGSLIGIEQRLESLGGWLRDRFAGRRTTPAAAAGSDPHTPSETLIADMSPRERFVEGFVSASLLFCVGPLTILGSLSDGLGNGADQLLLKSVLDGFAAIAFAASLGAGVMVSAVAVAVIQGLLTLVGFLVGSFLPEAHLDAVTATGGLLLVGLGLRLLNLKAVGVGDLLPALVVAPLLVLVVGVWL
ncbi:DUF554 domain-containing protein [Propionibacteriaceae bacterium Y1685]